LTALVGALAELRRQTTVAAVFDLAPRALCRTGMFERVMVSRVRGSTWLPQALYILGDDGQVRLEIDGVIEDLHIALASPLVEAEVVRRRLPALITDAQDEPRTHRPLVERTGTRDYVVAPIVADAAVVGLLHADCVTRAQTVSEVDRDMLRLFADGVGLCIERVELAERVQAQQDKVAEACAAAVRSVADQQSGPALELGVHPERPARRPASIPDRPRPEEPRESARLARLTGREREVLALLASGATNAQLADRLTVAESTVKSHVKHILHKLGAANRAAAISCYLRETRNDERRSR
jgi:DNA-binding CsgD family transcriptional regulator